MMLANYSTTLIASVIIVIVSTSTTSSAQTRSVRDTATAYGARLNAKGLPADFNERRVNSRIASRVDTRLSLRVERYRPGSTNNPSSAYEKLQDYMPQSENSGDRYSRQLPSDE